MRTVHEIERELQEAKNQEKLNGLQNKLNNLKEKYEGKCFGTHTFERNNKSTYSSASYYEKFWIKDNSIVFLRWSVTTQRMGKNYTFVQDQLSFTRQKSEINGDNVTEGNHYLEKKEVSLTKFMQLWDYGEIIFTKLNDAHNTILEQKPFDLLRVGTSNDERILADAFNYLKLDYIDITQYPHIFNALQYKHLPFFQEQKYLPRIYAKQILEYQIKLWQDEKNQTWRSYDDRYDKWIKIIQDFIKTI